MLFNASDPELRALLARRLYDCLIGYKNSTTTDDDNGTNEDILEESDETILNSDNNKNSTLYCPRVFDAYLCWPKTKAGSVAQQHCPDFVEGFSADLYAHKTCLDNGEWYKHPESNNEWSNYTGCIDYADYEFRQMVNELYVRGYAISLITLFLSLGIFLGFRSLRCTRIRIHVHLFMSLAFTCILWIIWYKVFIERPENITENHAWCIILHLLIHYMMLANYFWMFCEGLHLHLVLVVVFVKDTVVMRWFMMLGWIAPLFFLIPYGFGRGYHPNETYPCWMEESPLMWILTLPVCISLLASFFFLINVVRVLVKKLHPCSAQPAPLAIRKAVRATIILVPLFGLQHFLLPYRPDHGTQMERIYQIMSAFLVSLQGFCVSCLFCFANHDVMYALRNFFSRLLPGLIPPLPPGTNTGHLPTQTPSRELGV